MSVPRTRQGEKEAFAGRHNPFDWAAYDADRVAVAIEAADTVRFKLSRTRGGTPVLDLTSTARTALKSGVVIESLGSAGVTPASGQVILSQGDTASLTGKYYWELLLIDDSETNPDDACKVFMVGTMTFDDTQEGDIDL